MCTTRKLDLAGSSLFKGMACQRFWQTFDAMVCPHLEILFLSGSIRNVELSRVVEAASQDTIP
uniref:Uncharacterized protein n=1 Tax=Physcomitrium patens TaxID=3218 RepID=A0A7I4B5Q1_PHYPA